VSTKAAEAISAEAQPAIYVYEAPLRIWHWVNALSIVVLMVTGYLIAHPLPSMPGEASENFLMGYIRFAHFAAAYIFVIGFVFRIYWAFMGNGHARQLFLPPVWSRDWWGGVWHEVKWYAFLTREPRKYTGHNPLATLFMHFMLLWGTIFMIVTGLALYGEGAQAGHWTHTWFTSWVIPLFGQSQAVHTFHNLGMWYLLCFVIIHVYVAIREDIMSRQSLISTMVSGWRMFKDDRPVDDGR